MATRTLPDAAPGEPTRDTVKLQGTKRLPNSAVIPDSHRDLIDCPPVAALTMLMPDGSPHTSPVWCEFDGVHVLVNTMRGFLKERNMRRDPRVTLLCYDPAKTLRSLEVRGRVVAMTEDGAAEHAGPARRALYRPALLQRPGGGWTSEARRRCSAKSCRSGS